jgi:hypothetical protein
MDTPNESRRPNERLADEVTLALIEAGFFPESERESAYERIASGGARSEDWSTWAEAAVSRSKEGKLDG